MTWGLVVAKTPVDAGIGAIGASAKPAVGASAPTAGIFPPVVPKGALARPPAGVFDEAPKMCGFPTNAFHKYPVGCWLGMMNVWAMANKVKLGYSSTSQTGRRWCRFGVHRIYREQLNQNVGKKGNGDRQRVHACGAVTMQE